MIPAHPLALDAQRTVRRAASAGAARATTPPPARAASRSASTRPSSRSATRASGCSSRCSRSRARRWTAPIAGRRAPLVRIGGDLRPTDAGPRRGATLARPRLSRRPAQPGGAAGRDRRRADRPLPRAWPRCCRSSASTSSRPSAAGRCRTRSGGGSPRSRASWRSRSRRSTATRRWTWCARVAEAGRDDVALYTGNDDNIVVDLVTPFRFARDGGRSSGGSSAGCSGTGRSGRSGAVALLERVPRGRGDGGRVPAELLRPARRGHRRQRGVLRRRATASPAASPGSTRCSAARVCSRPRCLDSAETLSPGQAEEIDRVCRAYPHLNDDEFVAAHLDEWL